jgi:hypothetical protein
VKSIVYGLLVSWVKLQLFRGVSLNAFAKCILGVYQIFIFAFVIITQINKDAKTHLSQTQQNSQGRRRRINATGEYDSEESEGWQTQQISQGRRRRINATGSLLMQLVSI